MEVFRFDNTEGYSVSELAILNAEFARRTVGIDWSSMQEPANYRSYVCERILADYDNGKI